MSAQDIRCQFDLELLENLKENYDVKRVIEWLTKKENEMQGGVRRKLLSTSVRLSRTMAPDIHKMADECMEKLGASLPLELYVFASPQYNAMCFKPEDGRLFVMFASSLLEAFDSAELKFVMGHEVGHHIYKHHDIPIGYILQGNEKVDPKLVLELFAWSRYAEISADRAGAHCAHDLHSVSKALFKLASGLSDKTVEFDLDDFLHQVDDMKQEDLSPGRNAPKEDWFSTHPFSPLRVKALQLFDQSEFLKPNGISSTELETKVQSLMGLMEPSYMEGKTETATFMRRLLYAGTIVIANASDGIGEEEIKIFERFFGTGEFSRNIDVARIIEDLPNRVQLARENISQLNCMQVLRDLCLVARASGQVTTQERERLDEIAKGLDLSTSFIDQTLAQQLEMD